MDELKALLNAINMEDELIGDMSFRDMEKMGLVEMKRKPIDLILAEGEIIGQKARIDHLQGVARVFDKEDVANSEAIKEAREENRHLDRLLNETRHENRILHLRLDRQEKRQAQLIEENVKLNAIVDQVSATLNDLSNNKKVTKKAIFEALQQALANNQAETSEPEEEQPDEV